MPNFPIIEDFPTFEDFCRQFNSEQVCADALFQARWPDGFRCPTCRCDRFYPIRTRRLPLFECASCRQQTSLTAGTVLERSATSLVRWFQAFYLLSRSDGISANRLSAVIEVTYKTAWLIAHKIRNAMQQQEDKERLAGTVQIEPFHYGDSRYPDAKQPLVLAGSFDEHETLTQVKIIQPHPDHVEKKTRRILREGMEAFQADQLAPDAQATVRGHAFGARQKLLPIKSGLGSWLNDTFHGIGAKHLQAYAHEFAHRLNLGYRKAAAFGAVLGSCAATQAITYKVLTRERPMLEVPWRAFGSRSKWKGSHMRYWG